jgi:hypothetical protein
MPDWIWDLVTLWRLFKGGGMGPGPLPCAGGSGDQPAALMDAFAIMSGAEAEFKKSLGES